MVEGDEDSPRSVKVASGETATLSCKAKGVPSPKISWTREDRRLLPSGREEENNTQRLTIYKTKMEDRGEREMVGLVIKW